MKNFIIILLIFALVSILFVSSIVQAVKKGYFSFPSNTTFFSTSGLVRANSLDSIDITAVGSFDSQLGTESYKDNFPVIEAENLNIGFEQVEDFEFTYGRRKLSEPKVDADMIHVSSFTEQPLYPQDYYAGKYINAKAGVNQLNLIPILNPGDNIGLIRDGYINLRGPGYIRPPNGYRYGSGLCWSTSAIGALMDKANMDFQDKFGLSLFVFAPGDRGPHSDYYQTYQNANNGRGYTVLQLSSGAPLQDYRFTINPELNNRKDLADIKIKIVMVASEDHEWGTYGQSIGGYILSNKKF